MSLNHPQIGEHPLFSISKSFYYQQSLIPVTYSIVYNSKGQFQLKLQQSVGLKFIKKQLSMTTRLCNAYTDMILHVKNVISKSRPCPTL